VAFERASQSAKPGDTEAQRAAADSLFEYFVSEAKEAEARGDHERAAECWASALDERDDTEARRALQRARKRLDDLRARREVAGKEIVERSVSILDKVKDELLEIADRKARHDGLPESAWIGEDKESNSATIEELSEHVLVHMKGSAAVDHVEDVRECDAAMATRRATLESYRAKMDSAPESAWVSRTKSDYEQLIADVGTELTRLEKAREHAIGETLRIMGVHGASLTADQMEALLATAVATEILDLSAQYENTRHITRHIALLLTSDEGASASEAVDLCRMAVTMTELSETAVSGFAAWLDDELTPRTASLKAERVEVREKTAALLHDLRARGDAASAESLRPNVESQVEAVLACEAYLDFLRAVRARAGHVSAVLAKGLSLARNTLETIEVTGEASPQAASSLADLHRVPFPALLPADAKVLNQASERRRQFQGITNSLAFSE
jgi:hypothetical protein